MKYTITINQYAVFTNGLINKTDFTDWAIIDYLKDFAIYKKAKRTVYQGEEYIWLNYNHLIVSLPLIKFKSKSALSQRINKLRQLGLIKTCQDKDNTLYYAFTDKLIDICFARQSDVNRIKAQNSSYPVKPSLTPPVKSSLTAQYKTKYSILNKGNNKDISFSSSLKPKNIKPLNTLKTQKILPQVDTDKIVTLSDKRRVSNHRDSSVVSLPQNDKLYRNNSATSASSAVKNVKGFSSLNGNIWKVLANIKQRSTGAKYES